MSQKKAANRKLAMVTDIVDGSSRVVRVYPTEQYWQVYIRVFGYERPGARECCTERLITTKHRYRVRELMPEALKHVTEATSDLAEITRGELKLYRLQSIANPDVYELT